MRATIVVIPTVEEQIAAGDLSVIDPERLRLPDAPMPLFRGQSYQIPRDLLGTVRRMWVEDGRLLGEVEINSVETTFSALERDHGVDLISIGITAVPARSK